MDGSGSGATPTSLQSRPAPSLPSASWFSNHMLAPAPITQPSLGLGSNPDLFLTLQAGIDAFKTGITTPFNVPNDDNIATVKAAARYHVDRIYTAIRSDPVAIDDSKTDLAMKNGLTKYASYVKDRMMGLGINPEARHLRLAWGLFDTAVEMHEKQSHNLEADELLIFTVGNHSKKPSKEVSALLARDLGLTLTGRLAAMEDTFRDYKLVVKDCALDLRSIQLFVFRPEMAGQMKVQSSKSNNQRQITQAANNS